MNSFKIVVFLAVCFSHQALGTFDVFGRGFFSRCFKPKPPANGKITPEHRNVFSKNQKIWISCGTNYDLVGAKDLKCLGRNKWRPALPKCVPKVVQCEKPKEPRDGFIVPKDETLFDVGEKIWFKCDRGFDLNGVKDLKCLSNRRWSAPFPRCDRKVVKCERPDEPDNGSIRPDDQDFFDVNEKIWFGCERGFELKGKKDLQCRSNGKWSDKIPRCERKVVKCERPDEPDNGSIRPDDKDFFDVNEKIWFSCERGFELKGKKDLQCRSNGKWSDKIPRCERKVVKCERPDEPDNGSIRPDDKDFFDVNEKIWFGCERGFELKGKKDLQCRSNGKWSDKIPRCERKVVKCERPDEPDNGSIRPDDKDFFDVNEKIWFGCERGFELKGKKDLQCRSNGKWSDKIPRCERKAIKCERPDEPDNGSIRPDDQDLFDVDEKIWFSCERGFELKGKKDLRCRSNGKWSDRIPRCEPAEAVKCKVPDAPRKGHISPAGQTFFDVRDEIWFGCQVGYFLVGKESRTCLPNGQWSGRNPRCFFKNRHY
ncbi:E-selectin-like isoform X2 [Clavelina lepadiformis]|uniref:E-selectin-like isoform X2 n=1 Tax=Clavelina lepadiformis TaxID=159417 RepID=UPI0040421585